ncbi:MAG: hypothetical protein HN341_04550 [Verrucomicrobia bacterium]|jgi:hypothetical protein|nr:hypothetical protein [Verrucomicrobiota bacterium]
MKPAICAHTSGSIRTQSSGMTPMCSLSQSGSMVMSPSTPPPDGGERIVELCFDDPFPDYDTEPVMAYANDPEFAA